ncbi:MAG: gliding motility-associated C-terminal domain-containing protein [Bacteroidetes bacterium]|nr:gliding motility-associated C-terminal domain-containing protein [Bacteroidota bacterium]
MNRLRKWLFPLLLIFLAASSGKATHIVGGDFYYKKVSSTEYDITLKLYVDCQNGLPNAIATDAVAIIGLWDASTSKAIDTFHFRRTKPTRLNKLHYKCLIPPQDVCVDEYVYVRRLTLDPGTDGIILSFERCCRNNTINNLFNPGQTGATYWVKIPGSDLASENSSAVFKELPPNYICTDAPLVFDHSATDPDGDSLVYELYQPYSGGTYDQPRPDNSWDNGFLKAPPFKTVFWKTPYHTNDQMAGDPIMEINRFTGELTVTPTVVGQFVIGIKVKEYRDGVLISETLRDYQMNVKECDFYVVSAFGTAKYSCSDTVNFTNKSLKATNFMWDFGDPTRSDDTSSSMNPTYVYPKDGKYTVKLKAWTEICEDEYEFTLQVINDIDVDLGPDIHLCTDNIDLFLSTRKFDATKVVWNNGKFGPTIRVTDTGTYSAQVFYDQCTDSDTVLVAIHPIHFSIPTDSIFCDIEDVDMIADAGIKDVTYRWSPSPADTFRTLHIQDTGIYWVRIRNGYCQKVDSITVYLPTKPEFGDSFFVCNEFERTLDAGDIPGLKYLWNDGSTDRFFTITKEGTYWVKIDQKGCIVGDTMVVTNPVIHLDLGPDTSFCDSVYRFMIGPSFMQSYLWQDGSSSQSFTAIDPGTYHVFVVDTMGCEKSDTVRLTRTFSPTLNLGNDTSICLRMTARLGIDNPNFSYLWNNGETTQYIEVEDSGYYVLKITDEAGCTAYDTVHVAIDINALPNDLYIPNAFSPNGDGLNELFPFRELINQPEYRVRIFNRWGQKLFDSELDNTQHWDATFNGERVKLDAYVYMVDYRGCDGLQRHLSGTVTVLE